MKINKLSFVCVDQYCKLTDIPTYGSKVNPLSKLGLLNRSFTVFAAAGWGVPG